MPLNIKERRNIIENTAHNLGLKSHSPESIQIFRIESKLDLILDMMEEKDKLYLRPEVEIRAKICEIKDGGDMEFGDVEGAVAVGQHNALLWALRDKEDL